MAEALTTRRLLLRRWCDADREPFAALNADPAVMAHLPTPLDRPASDALIDRIERHFTQHGFGQWAVEVPGVARLIGFVGLTTVAFHAPFTPAVEVGWRLSRSAWGHGYATEAATASLADARRRLGFQEVVSFTVPANRRSRAVMERLGLRRDRDGDFDHPGLPVGHPLRRHVLYRGPTAPVDGRDLRAGDGA